MKRALIRLVVAILGLFASLLELTIRVVQLGIVLLTRLAHRLEGPRIVIEPPRAVAPTVLDTSERLTSALTGLGFRAGPARAYAATVRARLTKEPLEGLVREGIAHLSS
jgi:hypothetical protein